ncbi:general substrate transporter [Xylariaceae sp. FL1272]|nr:general substrate transporter [Xylariaceae sp. FL1272]
MMAAPQYLWAWIFCTFAALGAWLYGYDGVYFTGVSELDVFQRTFGSLQSDGTYGISPSTLSATTSLINVGELVGTLSSAPINDFLGRKGGWLIGATLVSVGVILQVAGNSTIATIMGGRVLLGLGVGVFCTTSPLYIADVAPTPIRGPLLSFWQLTLSISQIVAAGINRGVASNDSSFAWRFPTGFQLIFPALIFSAIWFVPESPRWLIRKGKISQADNALRTIHREDASYDPAEDISTIQRVIEEEKASTQGSSWVDLIRNPIERRKVVFSAGALIAQQINGIQWFYYFGTKLGYSIGLSDPFLITVIVFVIQLFVVLAALLLSNKIPRRPLLLTCTSIMMLSIFIVGTLGIGGDSTYVSPIRGKVIIAFVIIEIVAFNFSWGPLGWTIASEMAVGPNRNKIYSIAVASFWISVFVTVFTLPYLYYTANLGPKTGFVYTGLCVISLAYVYFCVGEVTGRSMEEIESFFQNRIPAKQWKHQPRLADATSAEAAKAQNDNEDLEKSEHKIAVEQQI